ncbi:MULTISPECIES: hypothetical protein [unclassified Acinetobacter]|uniref:hypothetical protein n=1 Tax=unclassified Acinetobacter TaxID=196816 RepID=UPI001C555E60|nr:MULTISPECIES: hypothetical protein [unclassified Acinetobacter]
MTTYDDYLSLASRGDIAAQIKLGEMYEMGCGVEKNDLTAQGWYQKAVDQGDAEVSSAVVQKTM